jgi:flagellar protein FlaG
MSDAVISSANFASTQYQGVAQGTAAPAQPAPAPIKIAAPNIPTDAEVVSKVVNTEIKPSSVNETSQPSQAAINKAAEQIQSFVHSMGRNLQFSVDGSTGYHVVTVTNPDTGEVVRQMPSPELLKIAQSLPQFSSGLVNQKA